MVLKVQIGSKYEQAREELRERIMLGMAKAVEDHKQYTCTLCSKRISGKAYEVHDCEDFKFYVDESCLKDSKRSSYKGRIPVSLN